MIFLGSYATRGIDLHYIGPPRLNSCVLVIIKNTHETLLYQEKSDFPVLIWGQLINTLILCTTRDDILETIDSDTYLPQFSTI